MLRRSTFLCAGGPNGSRSSSLLATSSGDAGAEHDDRAATGIEYRPVRGGSCLFGRARTADAGRASSGHSEAGSRFPERSEEAERPTMRRLRY